MQHPHTIADCRSYSTSPSRCAGLEKTTGAPLPEAPTRKNEIDTGASSSPTAATKAENVPSVMEQPAPQSVPEQEPAKVLACSWSSHAPSCAIFWRCGVNPQLIKLSNICYRKMKVYVLTPCLQPVQAEEVSAPHVTASAPRAPAAEEPEQADAKTPAPSAELAAEAASAEPVTAQPTPAALEARPESAEAVAAQPGPAEASGAQPAVDAPVMPEAAPAPEAVASEAAPKLEEIPLGLLGSLVKKQNDPAKPSPGSAPPNESQGELSKRQVLQALLGRVFTC